MKSSEVWAFVIQFIPSVKWASDREKQDRVRQLVLLDWPSMNENNFNQKPSFFSGYKSYQSIDGEVSEEHN